MPPLPNPPPPANRQRYAVTTARDVSLWEVDHELDYNVLRGGHEKVWARKGACILNLNLNL